MDTPTRFDTPHAAEGATTRPLRRSRALLNALVSLPHGFEEEALEQLEQTVESWIAALNSGRERRELEFVSTLAELSERSIAVQKARLAQVSLAFWFDVQANGDAAEKQSLDAALAAARGSDRAGALERLEAVHQRIGAQLDLCPASGLELALARRTPVPDEVERRAVRPAEDAQNVPLVGQVSLLWAAMLVGLVAGMVVLILVLASMS